MSPLPKAHSEATNTVSISLGMCKQSPLSATILSSTVVIPSQEMHACFEGPDMNTALWPNSMSMQQGAINIPAYKHGADQAQREPV